MSYLIKEFKEFAIKGNAVDMAVGVIVGGAFGKIISSIVNDLIMPPIGWLIGGINFTDLRVTLPSEVVLGHEIKAATINYGNFIQVMIDFLIISFCVFMLVKLINRMKRKRDARAVEEAEILSREEKLLTEIRDLLKENSQNKK